VLISRASTGDLPPGNCFNVFNRTNFLDPSFDVTNPSAFGVINTQLIPADRLSGSRWIQFALRLSF
jgi:hypothetical protein